MTENEKIELFDKWYDENYDEWAEGEEGIALREELEQAFKGGVEVLEAENAELKSDNDARKFAMVMSEKVEKQLREEIAELKSIKDVATLIRANNDTVITLMQLNNMLVTKNQQLTKAKKIIKQLLLLPYANNEEVFADVTSILDKAEQFLSEVEK